MAVAFVIALALTPAFRAAARRWGLLDRPNARSSHQHVVPRGGGAAIVVAVLIALGLAGLGTGEARHGALPLVLGAVALAAIGLWDDRHGLPAFGRLAAQFVVGSAVVASLGGLERLPLPAPLDAPLGAVAGGAVAVLWIVTVVNFFNFLDGIDGLAAVQAVVTAAGIALAGWDPFAALLAATLAGATAGFLPYNWSRGQHLPGRRGQLLPGVHSRDAPAGGAARVAAAGRTVRGPQPVVVPGRRRVDARAAGPQRRSLVRGSSRAPVPAAGAASGAMAGWRPRSAWARRL